MKVLAIIGSPKGKGAGYKIAGRIEEALRRRGDVQFEYLVLKEQNVEPCRGCFLCVTRGESYCPIEDDRERIERKIEESVGIVLVSPCYVSNVTAIMKNFMDRICYTNHRPRFLRQKLMLVSNAGAGMEQTIGALRLALGAGPRIAAELTCLTPPWPLAASVQRKQQKRLETATSRFYEAIKADEPRVGYPARPSLSEYIRFRFFKKISADTREYLRADYAYYRERDNYYYDVPIAWWKRLLATAILTVSMFFMKDLAPGPIQPRNSP
jgi:multimeric flavodoxin WrbA